jgi:hypothetical protein
LTKKTSQKDIADIRNAGRVAKGTLLMFLTVLPAKGTSRSQRRAANNLSKFPEPGSREPVVTREVGAARDQSHAPLVPRAASAQIHTNQLCFTRGGDAMARNTMDFARQNTEQATDWMRAIAEQNLNQSKAAFEGLLSVARNAVRDVDQQAAVICEHSMSFAEETLSNTFDFAHKLLRMREPQEFAQIQGEFVSRQAQLLGDQTKELGQKIMQGAQDAAKSVREASAESSRRRSEAA